MSTGERWDQHQKFRGKIEPHEGHWWALMDVQGEVKTWAPIGAIATLKMKDLLGCYRVARWYYGAGILDQITGPIIREDGKKIVEVIRGTS